MIGVKEVARIFLKRIIEDSTIDGEMYDKISLHLHEALLEAATMRRKEIRE